MNKKVIAFDSWTGGASNIEPLVLAFKERGLDLLLIHIGSWGHDKGRPAEEYIGNLLVRDIRYYGRVSFREILASERPAAVLFLSTQAFAHRAFNRYCAQLGIPTIHLYHGLVRVQPVEQKMVNQVNLRRQLTLIWERLGKQIRYIWPTYMRALVETRASAKEWMRFFTDVVAQARGTAYWIKAPMDAMTTGCCVYTEADVTHAISRYGIPRERVFAVGNRDLVRFRLKETDLGCCLKHKPERRRQIIYIDNALIEVGAVFDSVSDFTDHLLRTSEALAKQGFDLLVKLHPVHYQTGVSEHLGKSGLYLVSDEEFVAVLKNTSAAIVEPSSASLIPALLGLPVFLARYGKLRDQKYGRVLLEYPLARELYSLDGMACLLDEIERKTRHEEILKWICDNAGPLPASEMPDRVAEAIMRLLDVETEPPTVSQFSA